MVKVTGLQRPGRGTIGESASRRDYSMSTHEHQHRIVSRPPLARSERDSALPDPCENLEIAKSMTCASPSSGSLAADNAFSLKPLLAIKKSRCPFSILMI
jgi:hypothetical protein